MNIGDAIKRDVESVTKEWTKYRKQQMRSNQAGARAWDRYLRRQTRKASIRDIAFAVMEEAYMKASANNTLPAAARQIMYQARPMILAQTDKDSFDDQYFTQTLLPDYMALHSEETAAWDVVFDARGHLWEPHTGREVPLGTLDVRAYLARLTPQPAATYTTVPTLHKGAQTYGPAHRYQAVLFIEKEGFMPTLQRAQIAERYDMALMSTKGVSSTAARTLLEGLNAVPFLVLHDFDTYGFSILGTLRRNTRRFQFSTPPEVIDLGLRLADVEAEGLESEPVSYGKQPAWETMIANGVLPDEMDFLVSDDGEGQRVELNAFTSDHFIAWIERKLEACAVKKVIPDEATLTVAYRRACYVQQLNAAINKADKAARAKAERAAIPKALRAQVAQALADDPTRAWDDALTEIAEAQPAKRRGSKAA